MPVFAQFLMTRLVLLGVSTLAFLGLVPEIEVPENARSEVTSQIHKEVAKNLISKSPGIPALLKVLPEDKHPDPESSGSIINPQPGNQIQPTPKVTPEVKPTPAPTVTTQPIPEPEPIKQAPVIIPPEPAPQPDPTPNPSPRNLVIGDVLVNIICTQKNGNAIKVTTGSGVVIASKGVILTNAHVAQLFLLRDYYNNGLMECAIRRENMPAFGYTANLLYLPSQWIEENKSTITQSNPRGTGEMDYALLYITGNTNPILGKPDSFPSTSFDTREGIAEINDAVTVAGYPGNHKSLLEITRSRPLVIENVRVRDVFTFSGNNVDIMQTSETNVAQTGSSGGGVFENNTLMGTIVSIAPGSNNQSKINALTTAYIDRHIKQTTGRNLPNFVSGDVEAKSQAFQSTVAPLLSRILGEQL